MHENDLFKQEEAMDARHTGTEEERAKYFAELERRFHDYILHNSHYRTQRPKLHVFREAGDDEGFRFWWAGEQIHALFGVAGGHKNVGEFAKRMRKDAEVIMAEFKGPYDLLTISFSPPEGEIHWSPCLDRPKAYRAFTPDEQAEFWDSFNGEYIHKM